MKVKTDIPLCSIGRGVAITWFAAVATSLLVSGHVPVAMLATAAVAIALQIGVLLPLFILSLRLDRRAVVMGAAWGSVAGAAGFACTSLATGVDELTGVASLACGAIAGAWSAFVLRARADGSEHWFPAARADRRPSPWWYWGRAVYVSRRDYWRIFKTFVAAGAVLAIAGLAGVPALFTAARVLAVAGLAFLVYSLIGLYRMYGFPARRYFERLLAQGNVRDGVVIADLHIGTYRTAFALAELRPRATVHTIDCWNGEGPSPEEAVADVRGLEPEPACNARIVPARATAGVLPLADGSCDVVVFGFGTHEIMTGGPREQLFAEAKRVLRPGGVALLFEHGFDVHNYFIFGPVIGHVTRRRDWIATMRAHFDNVTVARSTAAVDLLAGTRTA
jgi:SAM-dependent methyltransferase